VICFFVGQEQIPFCFSFTPQIIQKSPSTMEVGEALFRFIPDEHGQIELQPGDPLIFLDPERESQGWIPCINNRTSHTGWVPKSFTSFDNEPIPVRRPARARQSSRSPLRSPPLQVRKPAQRTAPPTQSQPQSTPVSRTNIAADRSSQPRLDLASLFRLETPRPTPASATLALDTLALRPTATPIVEHSPLFQPTIAPMVDMLMASSPRNMLGRTMAPPSLASKAMAAAAVSAVEPAARPGHAGVTAVISARLDAARARLSDMQAQQDALQQSVQLRAKSPITRAAAMLVPPRSPGRLRPTASTRRMPSPTRGSAMWPEGLADAVYGRSAVGAAAASSASVFRARTFDELLL
jgi:hypothetical protein